MFPRKRGERLRGKAKFRPWGLKGDEKERGKTSPLISEKKKGKGTR